jgi:activating signal cointegrator 1
MRRASVFAADMLFSHGLSGIEVRALSLLQPWASLMAFGEKRVETRGWETQYRGWLAIAASKAWKRDDIEMAMTDPDFVWAWGQHNVTSLKQLPLGAIVCIGHLVDCVRTEYFDTDDARWCAQRESVFGNYRAGRHAFIFDHMIAVPEPVPVKGSLQVYTLPSATELRCRAIVQDYLKAA